MGAAAASGDASAVVHLLPRVFEFVFAQMEEIKRDSANAHIRLIAPYLARHGAAYERAKFEVQYAQCGTPVFLVLYLSCLLPPLAGEMGHTYVSLRASTVFDQRASIAAVLSRLKPLLPVLQYP